MPGISPVQHLTTHDISNIENKPVGDIHIPGENTKVCSITSEPTQSSSGLLVVKAGNIYWNTTEMHKTLETESSL